MFSQNSNKNDFPTKFQNHISCHRVFSTASLRTPRNDTVSALLFSDVLFSILLSSTSSLKEVECYQWSRVATSPSFDEPHAVPCRFTSVKHTLVPPHFQTVLSISLSL